METKFIGIDGFNEIENISSANKKSTSTKKLNTAQKTVRFIKRASNSVKKNAMLKNKTTNANFKSSAKTKQQVKIREKSQSASLDRLYNESRQGQNNEFNSSVKDSITKVVSSNKRKYAHITPDNGYRTHAILKKRAVLATVACLVSIMLSCVTVANALTATNNPTKENTEQSTETTTSVVPADLESASDNLMLIASDDEIQFSNAENFLTTGIVGLYIDNELIGATTQVDKLKESLEQILSDYREGYDEQTTTEFANDVELKSGSFDESDIMTAEEIIASSDGKFSIALSTDVEYTTELAYETETEYDENESSSYEKVKTEGKNGETTVKIRVTYTDGVQTDAVVSEVKTTKEPVNEVVVKGSKDGEEASDSSNTSASGQFIWPLPYTHTVTSEFEWRWGRMHNGIDIADSGVYGQSIVAADSGTVTFAGFNDGGYGYYVLIDHGNGYQTLYGHASSLAVSTGQTVSQGDTIAYVGSTGNSTGPHLHFEILVNGEKTNPLNYVS